MGKRYYCDYCDKHMVSSPQIIRNHNKGLLHEQLVKQHYHQFKDLETVLKEESSKKTCGKFPNCVFGFKCNFSHYTRQELDYIRHLLDEKRSQATTKQPSFQELYNQLIDLKSVEPSNIQDTSTVLKDDNGFITIVPWTYPSNFLNYPNLPKSVQPMQVADFEECHITDWG